MLALTLLQYGRRERPGWFQCLPAGSRAFTWLMGWFCRGDDDARQCGRTGRLALSFGGRTAEDGVCGHQRVDFPAAQRLQIPFSYQLGLIRANSLTLNLYLAPAWWPGYSRTMVLKVVPQNWFEQVLLIFAVAASCKLLAS